jgi:hypothetical protein
MERADEADRLRRVDDPTWQAVLGEAAELEAQAAQMLRTQEDEEPSRSVLYRSAATLMLEAGRTREAERLAAMGLAGVAVPDAIVEELRAVLENCRLADYLAEAGRQLELKRSYWVLVEWRDDSALLTLRLGSLTTSEIAPLTLNLSGINKACARMRKKLGEHYGK